MQDRVIQGQVFKARDNTVREKLLSQKQLTLDKCLQIGRAHETSKQQTQAISSSADAANSHINRVTRKRDYRNNFNKPQTKLKPIPQKCMCCRQFPAHSRNDCSTK